MDFLTSQKPGDVFTELRRLTPKVTGGVMRMREESYADATVAGKYKVLTAVAISVAIRCEPCFRAYVKQAIERGVSKDELVEFLNVAITIQGCPGEEWALKALGAYHEFAAGETLQAHESCCD